MSIFVISKTSSIVFPDKKASLIFNNLNDVANLKLVKSKDRALIKSGSSSNAHLGSNPSTPTSNDLNAF